MKYFEAQKLRDAAVCARCYGDLTIDVSNHDDGFDVYCRECGDAWNNAMIRRSSAERIGQQNIIRAKEIKKNLSDLFPKSERSKSKILDELGF